MTKIKVGVIFGGISSEHDISTVSGTSVIKNLDKKLYEIFPIYISTKGDWFLYDLEIEKIDVLNIGEQPHELTKIKNVFEQLNRLDVIFPVLHGLYGEDGTIQGLFELLKIPYVGCNVLSSALCMDKAYTKAIIDKANIPQVDYIYSKKYQNNYIFFDKNFNSKFYCLQELSKLAVQKLGLPVFIKPSRSGSSVGINKATNIDEVEKFINIASNFDDKIIIEKSVNAREIECAVIGNNEIEVSVLGEILSAENFYSFNSKYSNPESKTKIPADLTKDQVDTIQNLAKKAFKAVDGKGLSRIDFFIDKNNNEIFLNEINTMPGFTTISMYPQLFQKCGLSYSDLLNKLIELAVK